MPITPSTSPRAAPSRAWAGCCISGTPTSICTSIRSLAARSTTAMPTARASAIPAGCGPSSTSPALPFLARRPRLGAVPVQCRHPLFDWLDHQGVEYDVDHRRGSAPGGFELMKDYRVIMTGTHPEYHSTAMWDAMKAWIDRGGRLMYMGGNGWYWRVAFHATAGRHRGPPRRGRHPHLGRGARRISSFLQRRIRRPVAAHRPAAQPDLRRRLHRAGLRRLRATTAAAPDAHDPRAAFIFEGVEDEIIGDFGLIGGGAAGIELDCITSSSARRPTC